MCNRKIKTGYEVNSFMRDIVYAFDLDGTVTCQETLPLLAKELGLYEEMKLLTNLTMNGDIKFDK